VSKLPQQYLPDRQHEHAVWNELRPLIHDEVNRLPDKYRIPVVLGYLEGKTNSEVAELLHWPVGTVKGRLSRARGLLRSRLMRRGMALSDVPSDSVRMVRRR
jgi:RNA polymerase sigma-70 factor (ECF subfamily)